MSQYVDGNNVDKFECMTTTESRKLYEAYKSKFGGHPEDEMNPSIEQLSAMKLLIEEARSTKWSYMPYIDFSIFKPITFENRFQQTGDQFLATSSTGIVLKTVKKNKPNCWKQWKSSWDLLKTRFLLLDVGSLSLWDQYAAFMYRTGNNTYKERLCIITEDRWRFEMCPKLLRDRVNSAELSESDVLKALFSQEALGKEQQYWIDFVHQPAMFSEVKQISEGVQPPATTAGGPPRVANIGEDGLTRNQRKRTKKNVKKAAKKDGPLPFKIVHRRESGSDNARQICINWNRKTCRPTCPRKAVHICCICKSKDHPAMDCPGNKD